MLVAWVERRREPKVHTDAAAHELFAVEFLADGDGGVNLEERDYHSFEGLQWRPCVYRSILVDRLADLDKVRRNEYLWLYEILVVC